ncbi:MAG: hypothetical protein ACXVPX_07845 [Actinomycetota bacterium]
MALSDTMKWMGRSARNRAEAVSHDMKDRALTMRLDKAAADNERLKTENRSLKDAVEESQAAHERILSLLEQHRDETEAVLVEDDGRSHKGRWLLFLMLLAGGAWAWMKNRDQGAGAMDSGGRSSAGDQTYGGTGMTSAA